MTNIKKDKVEKPSLKELLWAIDIDCNKFTHNDSITQKASEIIQRNYEALRDVTYSDYDQENFKKLIASIEYNGQRSFNMSTFISMIDQDVKQDYTYIHEINRGCMINDLPSSSINNPIFDTTTKAFNCDTVGCIAGFATALALDWEQPKWLSGDTKDYYREMEQIACNFLNIPIEFGKAIFYGDENNVWAFAKTYSDKLGNAYDNIDTLYGEDVEEEDDWSCTSIDLNTIHYKDAVNLLQDVADGKILWTGRTIRINRELL